MNTKQMFPSKWLAATDFGDEDVVVTIKALEFETVGQKGDEEDKPVLYFREFKKGLVLNKTNCKTIAKLLGDETDDWEGKKITLFTVEVEYQGQQTLGIRVRSRLPKADAKTVEPETADESPY